MNQIKSNSHILLSCLVFILISSCKRTNNKDLIEIFILKERVKSDEGVPYINLDTNKVFNKNELKKEKELPNYDTIKKEFIYAGRFDVDIKQIKENPFINNDEIIMLDTVSGKIKLSANAINKIISLKPSMKEGIQFVICKNKKPLFTGYFWSSFSSYGSTWNCIEYDHTLKTEKPVVLNMYRGNGIDALKRQKIDFNKYHEILNVLSEDEKIGDL